MNKNKTIRLVIFASIMSFCTSTFVSAFIVYLKIGLNNNFLLKWWERFIIAWPVVFCCIIIFVPLINRFLDKFLKRWLKCFLWLSLRFMEFFSYLKCLYPYNQAYSGSLGDLTRQKPIEITIRCMVKLKNIIILLQMN